jgi:ABC-type polysaccharide/polyol phosphate transport system ATPase subunit
MGAVAIAAEDVSKSYRIYAHPRHRLLEALWRGRRSYHQDFWALRDVTFQVPEGTTLGVVGLNGSGKSTLLQVVAGVIQPTRGRVAVQGRVASLLELGTGFNPEFTGRENVLMHGAILGFDRRDMEARLDRIEAFAEIGEFVNQPVKTYSSGMFVRLAFAAAIHTDPDVLLVDEALAVGDAIFQHRCIRRIRELQDRGTTLLFVSHDIGLMKSLCTQALFLDTGRVQAIGEPAEIASLYHAHVARLEGRQGPRLAPAAASAPAEPAAGAGGGGAFRPDAGFERRAGIFRHGTGAARIRTVEVLDEAERPLTGVAFDQAVVLRIHLEFLEEAPTWILGYFVRDRGGIDVLGTNTYEEQTVVPARKAGDTAVVDFRQRWPLIAGSYSVTLGLAYNRYSPTYFDWVDNALVVEVLPPVDGKAIHAKVWLPVDVVVHA